ncbi:MAG: winged helix-turn-helix transcriptional regulator [Vicingaceae bacterium]
MELSFRCDCPITSALDVLGDKWMLVLVKLMLLEHKQTFKAFRESDEGIATNILTNKLKLLEELELVQQARLPNNKKTKLYQLTEKGLSLTPIIVELALWSDAQLRDLNPIIQNGEPMAMMRKDKAGMTKILLENYRTEVLVD